MTKPAPDYPARLPRRSATGQTASPKTELLAPAGGLAAFFAALDAGADAVYCGLTNFSARAKAKNFTLDEIQAMVACAHAQGKKLYVALNTLIKETEMPLLLETLAGVEESGIDGLIIQDMGVFRLARHYFPGIPLHGSTQMTIHNRAGVNILAGLGFTRVVLARELSLPEISAIRQESDIELEHFVHGALCYSISGQCLFSSFLTGKSGNRGRCEQPCRRRYSHSDRAGYYFSTTDFSTIDFLPQLIEAGVTSFKIEGRMKNAEYVGRVVTAYRLVLDAPASERDKALQQAKQELDLSFSRRSSSSFLSGQPGEALPPPTRKGTMGRYLGKIEALRGRTMEITLTEKLHIGDRLKILPPNDRTGVGLTVLKLLVNGREVKMAPAGKPAAIHLPDAVRVKPGAAVYKVGGREIFSLSESACRKRLAGARQSRLSLFLELEVTPEGMKISGEVEGVRLEQSYGIQTSPARTTPLDETILSRTFAKTGDHAFSLAGLKAINLPAVVVPPSRLNEIRRDYYRFLAEELKKSKACRAAERLREITRPLPPFPVHATPLIMVSIAGPDEIEALQNPLVHRLVLQLRPENIGHNSLLDLTDELRNRIIWDIPAIIFPGDWEDAVALVSRARDINFTRFRLNNIGHLALFADRSKLELIGGPMLYSLNTEADLAWRETGLCDITFSMEDDRENIRAMLIRAPGFPAWITVYGPIPLLTSRIPLAAAEGDTFHANRQSEALRLRHDHGLTILESGLDFSLLNQLAQLRSMGLSRFHVDLTGCGFFSQKGQKILQALTTDRSLAYPTTSGNFLRGLE
jgi:putative protease